MPNDPCVAVGAVDTSWCLNRGQPRVANGGADCICVCQRGWGGPRCDAAENMPDFTPASTVAGSSPSSSGSVNLTAAPTTPTAAPRKSKGGSSSSSSSSSGMAVALGVCLTLLILVAVGIGLYYTRYRAGAASGTMVQNPTKQPGVRAGPKRGKGGSIFRREPRCERCSAKLSVCACDSGGAGAGSRSRAVTAAPAGRSGANKYARAHHGRARSTTAPSGPVTAPGYALTPSFIGKGADAGSMANPGGPQASAVTAPGYALTPSFTGKEANARYGRPQSGSYVTAPGGQDGPMNSGYIQENTVPYGTPYSGGAGMYDGHVPNGSSVDPSSISNPAYVQNSDGMYAKPMENPPVPYSGEGGLYSGYLPNGSQHYATPLESPPDGGVSQAYGVPYDEAAAAAVTPALNYDGRAVGNSSRSRHPSAGRENHRAALQNESGI